MGIHVDFLPFPLPEDVTHDPRIAKSCDRILEIVDGRMTVEVAPRLEDRHFRVTDVPG